MIVAQEEEKHGPREKDAAANQMAGDAANKDPKMSNCKQKRKLKALVKSSEISDKASS